MRSTSKNNLQINCHSVSQLLITKRLAGLAKYVTCAKTDKSVYMKIWK